MKRTNNTPKAVYEVYVARVLVAADGQSLAIDHSYDARPDFDKKSVLKEQISKWLSEGKPLQGKNCPVTGVLVWKKQKFNDGTVVEGKPSRYYLANGKVAVEAFKDELPKATPRADLYRKPASDKKPSKPSKKTSSSVKPASPKKPSKPSKPSAKAEGGVDAETVATIVAAVLAALGKK